MVGREPSPRLRVDAECRRRGLPAFVTGCAGLIEGRDVDAHLIVVLGGAHARLLLAQGLPPDQVYWLRVWAARGLLWAWDDAAMGAIGQALRDPAWRVREMAAKVTARHHLGDLLDAVASLRADSTPRVSAAATRAVAVLTASAA